MTNRLELNWKLDGFVDEQRYYCAETTIDPINLPVPKTILAGDIRTYIDTAIEAEKTYYVAIGSVRGGIEKLSDIAIVTTATIRLERDGTNNQALAVEFPIGSALPRDTWMHVEVGRKSGTTYGFFQGNLKGSSTLHNNIPFNSPNINNVSIGSGNARLIPNNWHLDGYIDDLRVTKGVCRHTVDFAPPDHEAQNF